MPILQIKERNARLPWLLSAVTSCASSWLKKRVLNSFTLWYFPTGNKIIEPQSEADICLHIYEVTTGFGCW